MRAAIVLGSILALGGLLAGCGNNGNGTPAEGDTVHLAVAGPMTGSAAAFGEMIRMGALLKEKKVNDAGGIEVEVNGARKKLPVRFHIEDDKGLAQEATSLSRKIAADSQILAVVGHFNSDCSLAAKPEYNRKGIVELSPGSTNVDVCQGGDWTFRNLYRDDQQGSFLARFAREALKLNTVAIVFESDNYGTGLKEAFEQKAAEIGLKIVVMETYQRGRTQDFKPHMTKVKAAGAEGVFISGLFNEAALIIKTAKDDLGMDVPFFGGDGLSSDDLLKTAGTAAEGVYVTTPFLFGTGRESADAQAFYDDFNEMHGKEPDTWAALTYDACGQILEAISTAGMDRKAIRDHLAAQTSAETGYEGVTGVTYFDANGDCIGKPIYVTQVINGKFAVSPLQLLD